jgi:NAD+ diphosphatase
MDHYSRSSFNFFVSNSFDRISVRRKENQWVENRMMDPNTRYIPVWRLKNLFGGDDLSRAVMLSPGDLKNLIPKASSVTLLGSQEKTTFFAIDLPSDSSSVPTSLDRFGRFKDLKGVAPMIDCWEGALLAYARAMSYWHEHHRFCGNCGSQTTSVHGGHIRVCTNDLCGQEHFPRTDPAIIVLVANGESALLGRQEAWPKSMYSTIAGFVEPGESLETAVVREVMEESGIAIEEVQYHSSQPWPFPCSIMLGFTAQAANRDIRLNDSELQDARWFSRDDLRSRLRSGSLRLPSKISIAYRLIEDWFNSASALPLADFAASAQK